MRSTQFLFRCLLATLSTGVAFAASPVAYVYVQTPVKGDVASSVYAYAAASDGVLTAVAGSPFTVTGNMIGNTGSHFVTLGADNLYSYDVSSAGVIGAQVSEINTQLYAGSECGTAYTPYVNSPGVMDGTGAYAYALLAGSSCYALQTYEVSKTSGELTFKGDTEGSAACTGTDYSPLAVPIFAGDNLFAYSMQGAQLCNKVNSLVGFKLESSGTLENNSGFTVKFPTPPSGWTFTPEILELTGVSIAHDASNHLAIPLRAEQPYDGSEKYYPYSQIGSFTVASDGNVSSTNTYKDMPEYTSGSLNEMKMSPSGKLLVVGVQTGVQFYHFNGSSPVTKYTGVIGTSGYITTMSWDKDNHLYAINGSTGRLHIYEATPSSVKEVAGSPYDNVCGATSCALIVRNVP